jgi:hypothetical protein
MIPPISFVEANVIVYTLKNVIGSRNRCERTMSPKMNSDWLRKYNIGKLTANQNFSLPIFLEYPINEKMDAAHIAINDTNELVVYALFKGIWTTFALLTATRVDGIMVGLVSKLVLI